MVLYADETFIILGDNKRDRFNTKTHAAYIVTKNYCNKTDQVLNENKSIQMVYSPRGKDKESIPKVRTDLPQNTLV